MKSKILVVLFLIVSSIALRAQTITLEFPLLEGKIYELCISQGDKLVQIAKDTVPKGGLIKIVIPKEYQGYKGIAKWKIADNENNANLDLIINNENFSVVCLKVLPNNQNVSYKNSQENEFYKSNYQKILQIFAKYEAALAIKQSYPKKTNIYKLANKEYKRIIEEYTNYQDILKESKLYTAQLIQIVNLAQTNAIYNIGDDKEKANKVNTFITKILDFEILYTSNHWTEIINHWLQLQTKVFKDDIKMMVNTTTILNRINNNKTYTNFVAKITKELKYLGKEKELAQLVPIVKKMNKLLNYEGELSIYHINESTNLYIKSDVNNQDKIETSKTN